MASTRIRKNDTVKIIVGKDKGSTGKVQMVDIKNKKVIVAGLNMVKKSKKKKSQEQQGGIISLEAPINISNVQLFSKGETSRITYKMQGEKKVRIAKKSGEEL